MWPTTKSVHGGFASAIMIWQPLGKPAMFVNTNAIYDNEDAAAAKANEHVVDLLEALEKDLAHLGFK